MLRTVEIQILKSSMSFYFLLKENGWDRRQVVQYPLHSSVHTYIPAVCMKISRRTSSFTLRRTIWETVWWTYSSETPRSSSPIRRRYSCISLSYETARGGVLHSDFKPPVVDWCVLQLSFLSFSPSLLLYLNVLFILLRFPSSPFWLHHRAFPSLCFHLLNPFKLRGSGFSSGGVTRCAGWRKYRVEPAGER